MKQTFENFDQYCDGSKYYVDPNKHPCIANHDMILINNDIDFRVEFVDINQYQIFNRNTRYFDNGNLFNDQQILNLPIITMSVDPWEDENTVVSIVNSVDGFAGFIRGAHRIPVIIGRRATSLEPVRKILKFPKDWMIKTGCLYKQNKNGDWIAFETFSDCETVDQCQQKIDKLVKKYNKLIESAGSDLLDGFKQNSNMSYPIGKVTNVDETNSYRFMPDKDNRCSVSLVYGFNDNSKTSYAMRVSGDFDLVDVPISSGIFEMVIDLIAGYYPFWKISNRAATIKQFAQNITYSYNPYSLPTIEQMIKGVFPYSDVKIANGILTAAIEQWPNKYYFTVTKDRITLSIHYDYMYVGSIVVDDNNVDQIIQKYRSIVQFINKDYTIDNFLKLSSITNSL